MQVNNKHGIVAVSFCISQLGNTRAVTSNRLVLIKFAAHYYIAKISSKRVSVSFSLNNSRRVVIGHPLQATVSFFMGYE